MPMKYENIELSCADASRITVRAQVLVGVLSGGKEIRVGMDRRDGVWNFTDIESGFRLFDFPDFDQRIAIEKFNLALSEITPKRLRDARADLVGKSARMREQAARNAERVKFEGEIPF